MSKIDILIRGGTVVDGTRRERQVADVAIAEGKVVKVGDLGSESATREIDAEGLVVAPGFIDPHTHYDAQIFWDPYCTASGWHGVTTVQTSNCGFGFAPLPKEMHERGLMMMVRTEQIGLETMKAGVPFDWETHPDFLNSLSRTNKGVNVASYFPLNPAMFAVMGPEAAKSRQPNDEELHRLKVMLGEALDAGALGMSFTSMDGANNHTDYDGSQLPTEFITDETVCALAEVLHERNKGIIQMLTRRPDSAMDFALTEKIARAAQRPVLYNAVVGYGNFAEGGAAAQLKWLEECHAAGLPVVGQGAVARNWLEYSMEGFNFFDIVPVWNRAVQGDTAEVLAKLSDPAIRAEMKLPENFDDVDWFLAARGPAGAIVADVKGHANLKQYEGRKVGDIAQEENRHPVDVFLDIACETKLTCDFRVLHDGSWDYESAGTIARHPLVILGLSDGGAHGHTFNGAAWPTDVLAWLVRDTHQLELEEAHYKLSAFPAQTAGYANRGTLEPGMWADVVVYDLENLKATPEFAYETLYDQPADEWRRVQKAEGYKWTIVNGEVTLIDGNPTGNFSGRVLGPGRS